MAVVVSVDSFVDVLGCPEVMLVGTTTVDVQWWRLQPATSPRRWPWPQIRSSRLARSRLLWASLWGMSPLTNYTQWWFNTWRYSLPGWNPSSTRPFSASLKFICLHASNHSDMCIFVMMRCCFWVDLLVMCISVMMKCRFVLISRSCVMMKWYVGMLVCMVWFELSGKKCWLLGRSNATDLVCGDQPCGFCCNYDGVVSLWAMLLN